MEFHRRLVWVTLFRAVVVAVLLGATAVFALSKDQASFDGVLRQLFLISGATFAVTLAYALVIRQGRPRHMVALAYVQIVGDTILAGALLWLTGGADSPFAFVFSYGVVNAAILRYRKGAILAAAISAASYAAMALAMRARWIPAAADYLTPGPMGIDRLVFSMVVNGAAFFLIAVLGAYLAEQARQAGVRVVKAEANLAALSALHERIVRSVSSGILTLDRDGVIIFLNGAGEAMLGEAGAPLVGRTLGEISQAFEDALVGPQGRRRQTRGEIVLASNKILGFAATAIGETDEVVVVFQDLTTMKEMERAVRRSEKLAAVGSLAAGLAHEIRNPLASMSGSIQLLQAASLSGEESGALMSIVLREVERLEGLIADFLTFARPRSPRLQRLDLSVLVEEAVLLFRNDPRAKHHPLECVCPPGLEVDADEEQIRQVVINLLLNAVQAGDRNRVEVRTAGGPEGAILEIIDEGEGMDAETLGHLFDPFFTTKAEGNGLGLASVHAILQAHHAIIDVSSVPGEGTSVTVRFPWAGKTEER